MSKKVWKLISFILSMVLFIGALGTNSISAQAAKELKTDYYHNLRVYYRWKVNDQAIGSIQQGGRNYEDKVQATFFDYGNGYSEYVFDLGKTYNTENIKYIQIKAFDYTTDVCVRLYNYLNETQESSQEDFYDKRPDKDGYIFIYPNTGKKNTYLNNYDFRYIGFMGIPGTKISLENITIYYYENTSTVSSDVTNEYAKAYIAYNDAANANTQAHDAYLSVVSLSNRDLNQNNIDRASSYVEKANAASKTANEKAIEARTAANNIWKKTSNGQNQTVLAY